MTGGIFSCVSRVWEFEPYMPKTPRSQNGISDSVNVAFVYIWFRRETHTEQFMSNTMQTVHVQHNTAGIYIGSTSTTIHMRALKRFWCMFANNVALHVLAFVPRENVNDDDNMIVSIVDTPVVFASVSWRRSSPRTI